MHEWGTVGPATARRGPVHDWGTCTVHVWAPRTGRHAVCAYRRACTLSNTRARTNTSRAPACPPRMQVSGRAVQPPRIQQLHELPPRPVRVGRRPVLLLPSRHVRREHRPDRVHELPRKPGQSTRVDGVHGLHLGAVQYTRQLRSVRQRAMGLQLLLKQVRSRRLPPLRPAGANRLPHLVRPWPL